LYETSTPFRQLGRPDVSGRTSLTLSNALVMVASERWVKGLPAFSPPDAFPHLVPHAGFPLFSVGTTVLASIPLACSPAQIVSDLVASPVPFLVIRERIGPCKVANQTIDVGSVIGIFLSVLVSVLLPNFFALGVSLLLGGGLGLCRCDCHRCRTHHCKGSKRRHHDAR